MTSETLREREVGVAEARTPRVSVIVPAYSRVAFLRECLRSICAQTLVDWECIVVDDASPEGGQIREAVEEMGDGRLRYVRRDQNGGPGAARNTGVTAARARYFVCVDEDDMLVRDALRRLVEEIEGSGADVVCPQAELFGGRTGTRRAVEPTIEQILGGMVLLPNGWIMKRELWERVGGYDESRFLLGRDDWEIWIRIVPTGAKIKILDESLYRWRLPAAPAERVLTLEHRARKGEMACMSYVFAKHKQLYREYPEIQEQLQTRTLRWMLDAYLDEGAFMTAGFLAARLGLRTRSQKYLRLAARALTLAIAGEKGVEVVRRARATLQRNI
jgi:glycosyltransferase involved in cell wall biosynthesis